MSELRRRLQRNTAAARAYLLKEAARTIDSCWGSIERWLETQSHLGNEEAKLSVGDSIPGKTFRSDEEMLALVARANKEGLKARLDGAIATISWE